MLDEKDHKTRLPYEHYQGLFKQADPVEMADRTHIPYDEEKQQFTVRIMGRQIRINYPSLTAEDENGNEFEEYNAIMLVCRYLLEGKYVPDDGTMISYTDFPSGNLYFKAFKGRCLDRLAYSLGTKPDIFRKGMEAAGGVPVKSGDYGYRFEVFSGFYMTMAIWLPDEEFGPSSQITYSANFLQTFSTEDASVCGDIAIGTVKKLGSAY